MPFVASGDGRTYDSAARRPVVLEREVEDDVGAAFMGGTLRLPSRLGLSEGLMEADRLSENDGEVLFKETVDVFVDGED